MHVLPADPAGSAKTSAPADPADTAAPIDVAVRNATSADVDAVVAATTTAFFDDPLWGPAFPDLGRRAEQAAALWRLFVTSALRYPWLLVTEHVESAAVWLPPGGTDLTDDQHNGFDDFLVDIAGRPAAEALLAIFDQFDQAHPTEPHFYLSLLATHTAHRGRGLGMALLRESLHRIDAHGAPAYLESCNPVNDARYESVGFVRRSTFTVASGHVVSTMWRPARPTARVPE